MLSACCLFFFFLSLSPFKAFARIFPVVDPSNMTKASFVRRGNFGRENVDLRSSYMQTMGYGARAQDMITTDGRPWSMIMSKGVDSPSMIMRLRDALRHDHGESTSNRRP